MKNILNYIGSRDRKLLVCDSSENTIGCIAYTIIGTTIEIDYIGVLESRRGFGIGKSLIEAMLRREKPNRIFLETDNESVGFYRSVGFDVLSLGLKYENVERFQCEMALT